MEKSDIHARMADGRLYLPLDETLQMEQLQRLELLYEYNATRPHEAEKRTEMLRKMFRSIGEGCYIEPPFHANWAGKFVTFGKNVYANFNLTLVDDCEITVGDYCMFGPNVTVATAGHPVDPSLREQAYQYNLPIHIGNNVWIGAGAILLPGVTIGDNTVIGAGSVVTKDVPANVVAVGNPCRVLREITEQDKLFYGKGRPVEL
ncbi:MAG: sugar O-acetyltransferase [Oscillospiraceae bacterium]|nr:sugar O-acetyltransferase [Oscillospiraceae bacterium]